MDKITQEVISPQTESEPTSPLSPKRPRTDCMMTNHHSGKISFEFPELLTFRKTEGSASSPNTFQKNTGLICTAECGREDIQHEKHQRDDTKLNVTPMTKVTTSHPDDNTHTGSSEVCFITAERHFLHLGKDEELPVIETDKLNSYPGDDAGGVLAEFHTSNDTRADTSTCHDCERLGKSLEHEPPGGGSLPSGYDEDRRQGQNYASQIQAITLGLSEHEEVRCPTDCDYEDALHDVDIYNATGKSAEVEASNQKQDEQGFGENIFLNKEEEEARIHTSPSDYGGSKSSHSHAEASPSGNLAEARKTDQENLARWESDVKENVAVCDGETKGQVNETGMSSNSNPGAAECAEGSIVSCDVVLARNITGYGTETSASLETDYLCGARGGHAAGKMIAEAWSETADHTTETPMPARISQEPVEGDNDAGAFSVIDPAIWSETDREAEEKHCNSESAAGAELSPSIRDSTVQTPLPLYSNVSPPENNTKELSASDLNGHFNNRSGAQQCKGEKEDTCQSCTEPQPCSIPTNETHDKTGKEGICHWKSSPSSSPCSPTKPFTTGDERKESPPDTMGHLWEEQYQAGCFPISLDNLKTQEVEYSQTEIATMDETTEGKARKEVRSFGGEMKTDAHVNLVKSEDGLLQQNKQHKADMTEISTGNCISDWTEGKMIKCGSKSTLPIEDELGILLSCFPDYRHRAETFMVENKDEPFSSLTSLPPSDAVVPGLHDLSHGCYSQNADNPTAQHCTDRFSPVPSAFALPDRVPGGFDTFEKVQLLPDDDADGLGHSPLLTSLSGQLLKTSQRQLHHSMPGAESDDHKEISEEEEGEEEEEVEKIEGQAENMGNGSFNSGTRSNEDPDFIWTTHIPALTRPEQQPGSQSAPDFCGHFQGDLNPQLMHSTVSTERHNPISEANDYPKFEMKEHFDMVLEELNLYFEISTNNLSEDRVSSPEQCSVITDPQEEGNTSNCRECLSSPAEKRHRDASSDDDDDDNEDRGLEMCGADPVVSCTALGCDREQEVPLDCSHQCQEASMYSSEKHKESREMEQKSEIWAPSFTFQPFLEQLSHRQPEQARRLEPLRTCTRPIRLGLSRRAKTKHLHRPHPYK